MGIDAALAYAEKHTLHALLVDRDGTTLCERYANGYDAAKPHPLYSGTTAAWASAGWARPSPGSSRRAT
jgi:hypothetical protein